MRQNINTSHQMIRNKINEDMEAFLNKGGSIKQYEFGKLAKPEVSLRAQAKRRVEQIKNGEISA